MRIIAIIQARMGSTRLPGKVLKDIGGETMLARVVRRVRRAALLSDVVVATTVESADDLVAYEAERLGVAVFRGDEQDVLSRYYHAAKFHKADAVIRITSDCPFIEPEIIEHVVSAFLNEGADYVSNTIVRTYPRGLDTEVLSIGALTRVWQEASDPYQRTHVTPYAYQNPGTFCIHSVEGDADYSGYRLTVDMPEDLVFTRAVYARLGNVDTFRWRDVLTLLEGDPGLVGLNSRILQKTLQEG